jgi:ABC-type Na+ efflux pump permease subunit
LHGLGLIIVGVILAIIGLTFLGISAFVESAVNAGAAPGQNTGAVYAVFNVMGGAGFIMAIAAIVFIIIGVRRHQTHTAPWA